MPDYTPPSGGAGGGGAPTGTAGGGLAGTYPNPTLADAPGFMVPGADLHGYLTWSYDELLATGTSAAANYLQAGILYTTMLQWPYIGKAVTAVDVYVATAAVTATAGQCFVAIYGQAGGAALGSAAAETAWGTGTAIRSVSLSIASGSMPSTGPGTVIYVGMLFNGTTPPLIAKLANPPSGLANNQNRASSSPRFGSFGTGQTAVPSLTVASISGTGQNGTAWVAVR